MKSPPESGPDFTTVRVVTPGTRVNDAATVLPWFIVTEHAVPVQAPENPRKRVSYPNGGGLARGVNVTTVPAGNCALHTPGQLMPAGIEITMPFPAPVTSTVRR